MDYTRIVDKFVKLYLPGSTRFLYGCKLKVKSVDIENQKLIVEDTLGEDHKIHVSYFRFLNNKKIIIL
jgi:hypothetical protein